MNQFVILKSHIDAYTRKDGAVVGAHDDKRQKKSPAAVSKEAIAATKSLNTKFFGQSHSDRASAHREAAGLHKKAGMMYRAAIENGDDTNKNRQQLNYHQTHYAEHQSRVRHFNDMKEKAELKVSGG